MNPKRLRYELSIRVEQGLYVPVKTHSKVRWHYIRMHIYDESAANDVLIIAGLVAYWSARIHELALLDLYCPHVTSGRLAVCYSQRHSIFSSTTAFTTAKLR